METKYINFLLWWYVTWKKRYGYWKGVFYVFEVLCKCPTISIQKILRNFGWLLEHQLMDFQNHKTYAFDQHQPQKIWTIHVYLATWWIQYTLHFHSFSRYFEFFENDIYFTKFSKWIERSTILSRTWQYCVKNLNPKLTFLL